MPARTQVPELEPYVPPSQTSEKLDWAELEALDICLLDKAGGKEALAKQVLTFINKNGNTIPIHQRHSGFHSILIYSKGSSTSRAMASATSKLTVNTQSERRSLIYR
ncbi:hypothetical protein DTO271G3_1366 [Paecilomyces variotii]|nr:hypothetical protein DTO271G3_1366 [Paecilomyces variotii]